MRLCDCYAVEMMVTHVMIECSAEGIVIGISHRPMKIYVNALSQTIRIRSGCAIVHQLEVVGHEFVDFVDGGAWH